MIAESDNTAPRKIGNVIWVLFAVNFVVMGLNRYVDFHMPTSLFVELFYFAAIIHVCSNSSAYGDTMSKLFGPLFGIYSVWLLYSLAEIANGTSELDYSIIINRWFAEIRTNAFQPIYGFLIFAGIFNTKQRIRKFHRIWGFFVLLALAKCLMQQYVGFDEAERLFLVTAARTHMVNGIIRYFSIFSDAACFGSNMAATTVVFAALSFTTNNRKDRLFFTGCAIAALYCMMASGTRSAIIALAAGLAVYAVLSKNMKAIAYTATLGLATIGFLMFTNIGQGNSMIRRMRSAFNKDDASFATREYNKLQMEKYLRDVPMGIGAGIRFGDVPPSNKNYFLSIVPPDSTWVYIHIRYGIIGKYCFLFSFFGITIFGSFVVLTKTRHKEVTGQLAATVSGCAAMVIAGYSNQIMTQYPNCLLFFGTMGMLTIAEIIDKKAIEDDEEETRKMLEAEAAVSEGRFLS